MKSLDFTFDYARDASTALNWQLTADRARIRENLRTNADVLAAESHSLSSLTCVASLSGGSTR